MRNYKNNHKRHRFRNNGDRGYKRNGTHQKLNTDFSNGSDFKRKNPGRNNQNAFKLIEKYNELAREALSNGDKILSENYFQHADHFARISEKQTNGKLSESDIKDSNKDNNKPEKIPTTSIDLESSDN